MVAKNQDPVESWRKEDDSVVEIPDDYKGIKEHIQSMLKTAEVANVEMEIESFGHEDVTLSVQSETDEQTRILTFRVTVQNWRSHTGGTSAYSEKDMVNYTKDSKSEKPDRFMHSNGAFYHKLINRVNDLFNRLRPMFELESYDQNKVVFSGTVSLHRYDG